jgi:uncharacterized protein (DUF111 family)
MPADVGRHIWVDATAGVAGDMLLAALVDIGAPLVAVLAVVNAVAPEAIGMTSAQVLRGGLRATKVDVRPVKEQAHRSWLDIKALLDQADINPQVRDRAQSVFLRLAEAEARVHGVAADEVQFHEVGGWDSIADVVGVCAALDFLGVTSMSCSAIALGSGKVTVAHGELPVPVPAVLELSSGCSLPRPGPRLTVKGLFQWQAGSHSPQGEEGRDQRLIQRIERRPQVQHRPAGPRGQGRPFRRFGRGLRQDRST